MGFNLKGLDTSDGNLQPEEAFKGKIFYNSEGRQVGKAVMVENADNAIAVEIEHISKYNITNYQIGVHKFNRYGMYSSGYRLGYHEGNNIGLKPTQDIVKVIINSKVYIINEKNSNVVLEIHDTEDNNLTDDNELFEISFTSSGVHIYSFKLENTIAYIYIKEVR